MGRGFACRAPVAARRECLGSLIRDPIRSRIAALLKKVSSATENEPELSRLGRMDKAAARDPGNSDLKEAIDTILAFEQCYRLVLLGFERVLWLCKADGTITAASVARDPVVNQCCEAISEAAQRFQQALTEGATEAFRRDLERLNDVQGFLNSAAVPKNATKDFVEALLDRHTDVQRGKFDRGRRKLPWIERKSSHYELTLSRLEISAADRNSRDIRPTNIGLLPQTASSQHTRAKLHEHKG